MNRALAVTLCLAGCGRELHVTVDAAPADAAFDMAIPDNGEPPADAVTLTLTRQGVAIPGARVVFQTADSTVIHDGATDQTGRAWALMPSGGFVTAIERVSPELAELTTFAAVAPGDAFALDAAPLGSGTNAVLDVTVPVDAMGGEAYTIMASCGSGGADVTGAGQLVLEGCGANIDLVVQSTFDSLPTGRALFASGVALPAAGPLALVGTYDALATSTLTYTNVPDSIASVSGYQAMSATRRAYAVSDFGAVEAGAATVTLAVPDNAPSQLIASTTYPVSGEIGQQLLYEWGAATKNYTADLATALLPAYSVAPTYDLESHSVSWAERPGGAMPDVVRTKLQLYRDDIPAGHAWRWRLATARGATPSVTYPTLPILGFDFNPTLGDTVGVSELSELELPGGLAPWRTRVFAAIATFVTDTAGSLVLQTLYEEQL